MFVQIDKKNIEFIRGQNGLNMIILVAYYIYRIDKDLTKTIILA